MRRMPQRERRSCIVRASMAEFARAGFRGTRTKDVARAAGCSEALIFKFFPSKRALQKAMIEERIRQVGDPLPAGLHLRPPAAALAAIAERFLGMISRDPTFMRLLFYSGLEGEPLAPMFFRRRVARNIDSLAALIRQWMIDGRIRKNVDARLAAWCFSACVFQLQISRSLFGARRMEDRPGRLAPKIAELFLRGLRP